MIMLVSCHGSLLNFTICLLNLMGDYVTLRILDMFYEKIFTIVNNFYTLYDYIFLRRNYKRQWIQMHNLLPNKEIEAVKDA